MKGDFYIARNKELQAYIIEVIKNYRLPFKVLIQPIFPDKSINQLAYLFGVVCKRISDHTGHTPNEVYQAYKEHFNLDYSPDKIGVWKLRNVGASEFDTVDAEVFAQMIRADAVIEMGINIELPNECFVSELDFKEQDKIEQYMDRSERRLLNKIPKLSFRVFNRKIKQK